MKRPDPTWTTEQVPSPMEFASRMLERRGALLEEEAPGRLATLLPPPLISRLGWDEETTLLDATRASAPAVRPAASAAAASAAAASAAAASHAGPFAPHSSPKPIGFGTRTLEQLLELATSEVGFCRFRAKVSAPQSRDLSAEARHQFCFRTKVRIRFEPTSSSVQTYHLLHYVLSATSEDTHEEILSVVLNDANAAPVPELSDRLTSVAGRRSFEPDPGGEPVSALSPRLLEAAGREAARFSAVQLEGLAQALRRRRERDRKRLFDYYQEMTSETSARKKGSSGRRKAGGRPLDPEEVELRIAAIQKELDQKVRDLIHRYDLRVSLKPIALAVVRIPVLRAGYRLQWKKRDRIMPVFWNPLLGSLEPIPCHACGAGGYDFHVGEDLEPACRTCV